jgi:hypothetical protein
VRSRTRNAPHSCQRGPLGESSTTQLSDVVCQQLAGLSEGASTSSWATGSGISIDDVAEALLEQSPGTERPIAQTVGVVMASWEPVLTRNKPPTDGVQVSTRLSGFRWGTGLARPGRGGPRARQGEAVPKQEDRPPHPPRRRARGAGSPPAIGNRAQDTTCSRYWPCRREGFHIANVMNP